MSAELPKMPEPVAFYETEGDEWHIYPRGTSTYEHIRDHQKARIGVHVFALYTAAQLQEAARQAMEQRWLPIETAPKDRRVFYWVVPRTEADGPPWADGKDQRGYMHEGLPRSWGCFYKAVFWMPPPAPPALLTQSEKRHG